MRDRSPIEGTTQKFVRSTLWNQSAKMAQFGLGFLFTVVITRKLGKTLYGEYSLIISFCFFLSLFTHFGFENIVNTYIPKLRDFPTKISFLLNRLIFIRLIAILAACGMYLGFVNILDFYIPILPIGKSSIYVIGYVASTSLGSLLSRVMVSQHQLKYIGIVNVISALYQLICAYIFLSAGFRLDTLLLIVITTSCLSLVFYLIPLRKTIKFPKESFDLKPLYNFGKASWLTSLVEFGLGKQIDILLIGFFVAAASEAGYYNLAISTVIIISSLTTAGLSGVALTTFSEIENEQGRKQLGIAWESLIKLEFILSAPVVAFLAVYAHPFIVTFYSDSYLPAAGLVQVYACFFIIQRLIGGGVHVTALYAMEKAKVVLVCRFVGGLMNLILDIILIPKYGAMGAIVATGFCIVMTVTIEYAYTHKLLRHSYPFMFIFKASAAIILSLLILKIFSVQTIFSLIGVGIIYIFFLLVVLYFVKPLNHEDQIIIKNIDNSTLKWIASVYM